MLQIVICDDDKNIADMLSKLVDTILEPILKYHCFVTAEAKDVIKFAQKKEIDLLLIDIDMPELNGFETVKQLETFSDKTLIIFVTNIDYYVYESLKYHPFRYIRKTHLTELEEALLSVSLQLKKKNEELDIPINSTQNIRIKIGEIIYFESLHNNVRLITINNEYIYRSALKTIEAELKGKGFVRIHSGYLLNVRYVYLIKQTDVVINFGDSQKCLPVSRAGRSNLILEYKKSLR